MSDAKKNLLKLMTSTLQSDCCVDDLDDGAYSFQRAHMPSHRTDDELSLLRELIDRECESLRSELSSDEFCEDELLWLKAKSLACVQLLGASIFEDQKHLYKAYDIELAKTLYAGWSRLGLAFEVIAGI